jgi:hypothetical protein
VVDFPTPPFPEATQTTRETPGIFLLEGRPRIERSDGGVPVAGRPLGEDTVVNNLENRMK